MISDAQRKWYINCAIELCYSKEVIKRIKSAQSEIEVEQIMKSAREKIR